MYILRRSFLKGSAVLGAAALVGGISLLDAEKEVGKTLYFFPSVIKPASSYSDSKYFVFVDANVPFGLHGDWKLKREIYDRIAFYNERSPVPLKVEYLIKEPFSSTLQKRVQDSYYSYASQVERNTQMALKSLNESKIILTDKV